MDIVINPIFCLKGQLRAPSSKNYTTRYLLAAALAKGVSTIYDIARSEDSDAMQRCIHNLGANIYQKNNKVYVDGFGKFPKPVAYLDVGNAGAVLRFLMGVSVLSKKITFNNTYPHSLGQRCHKHLVVALHQMGVDVEHHEYKLPITVRGGQPKGGHLVINGCMSSQFLTSLLFITPLLSEHSTIEVLQDLKSKVMIKQTLKVLSEAGIYVEPSQDFMYYHVPGGQVYTTGTYYVEGDYPGAAAILAAAAITHSDVKVLGLCPDSNQGERAIVHVLQQMNVPLTQDYEKVHVQGCGRLIATEFDGDKATDAVLAMVAAAVFAQGTSRFYNIQNLRFKECDRISDYVNELKKAGANVEGREDEIVVHGCPQGIEGGVELNAHYDHRVIMSLCVIALRARLPIQIRDAHHVAKSYPLFFEHMISLGARIEMIKK